MNIQWVRMYFMGKILRTIQNRVYKESKCEYDVDSKKEQHNGWKATYAYIHIHTHTHHTVHHHLIAP